MLRRTTFDLSRAATAPSITRLPTPFFSLTSVRTASTSSLPPPVRPRILPAYDDDAVRIDLCYGPMCDPEYILKHLTGGKKIKDIVIPGLIDHLVVHITQYLTNPAKFYLWPASSEKGFTRGEIIRGVCKMYATVYLEEQESMLGVEVPRISLNRGFTSGKYGIWGHDIGDLQLHTGHYVASTRELGVSMDS